MGAYACMLQDSLDGNLADLDTTQNDSTDPVSSDVSIPLETKQPQGGHPLLTEKDVTSDSGSTTDTNLDNEFTTDPVPQKKYCSSKRLPQLCPVCKVGVKSKGALAFHLKSFHPMSRTYH